MYYDPTDRPNGSVIHEPGGEPRQASFGDIAGDLFFRMAEVAIGAAALAVGAEINTYFSRRRMNAQTPWSSHPRRY